MEQKNYTLRFFNMINDCIEKKGNKYYMLLVENENGKTIFSKMVKCNNASEMKQTLDLIRNDRLLVINYLMRNENKYIDNMIADLHEIVAEFFNNKKAERLETLLYNVCGYMIELYDEFLDFEHNEMCFGVTEEEHKKYFLGE